MSSCPAQRGEVAIPMHSKLNTWTAKRATTRSPTPCRVARIIIRTAITATSLLTILAPLSAGSAEAKRSKPQSARPNVVVILLDDVGFSDIGSFGGEIATPNLDALAKGGLRFTQFYNSARCSPSRGSLLSGTYPHQAGVGHLESIAIEGSRGLHGKLSDRVVTLAEVLKSAGYYTAMTGKWHVGMTRGVTPWQRGFDHSLASAIGELYYPDQPQSNARRVYIDSREVPANSPEVGNGYWYSSDMFVEWQSKFIKDAKSQRKPFFLYIPFVTAHFPLMAPPEDVARFKGKYMGGWDIIRRERFERQKQLGIIPPDTELPERLINTYDWDKLSAEDKDRFDTIMAVYAATISRMDRAIGTLVERLKQSGELDDTLILFMSDNGGNAEAGPDGRLLGSDPGGPHSIVFAGMNWATPQNTPFQYFKHYTEEGGIATPFIVHWPTGIDPELRGSLVRDPSHLIDVMPTLVEVSGATYPKTFNGHEIIPMQGRSLAPAFRGQSLTRAEPIFWEHEGNRAVRDGKWKLVARFMQPWELYDMSVDRVELHNLAAKQPERVRQMAVQWDEWARRTYVDAWQDTYDPYLDGRPRQNWGMSDIPERPWAMKRAQGSSANPP
jgi:arylsulfatase A-like enzyme